MIPSFSQTTDDASLEKRSSYEISGSRFYKLPIHIFGYTVRARPAFTLWSPFGYEMNLPFVFHVVRVTDVDIIYYGNDYEGARGSVSTESNTSNGNGSTCKINYFSH